MKKKLGIIILLTAISSAAYAADGISVEKIQTHEALEIVRSEQKISEISEENLLAAPAPKPSQEKENSQIVSDSTSAEIRNQESEIFLETHLNLTEPQDEKVHGNIVQEEIKEPTLAEKLKEVYHLEIERTDVPRPLLQDITTMKFERGPLESFHPSFALQTHARYDMPEGTDNDFLYRVGLININLDGVLKGGHEDFRLMLDPTPQTVRPFMQQFIQDAYIATNRIPHHRIIFGNTRPMVGIEGGQSPYTLPFINRSQISRTFGTVRKFGLRVNGNYDFVDYDLGALSSDTYFSSFFPGVEFNGWVNFKPLAKTNGKYGKIVTGGGIAAGKRHTDFFVTGAYAGYEYKRFSTCFEWAHTDGYNGAAGLSTKQASGFYATVAYKVTPKVQVLFRYDELDPNTNVSHNKKREYTTGVNYFIKGQAVRLILNYIFCQNDSQPNSHRILLGTQFLI